MIPSSAAKEVLSTLRRRFPGPVLQSANVEGFSASSNGLRTHFAASSGRPSARVLFPRRSTDAVHIEDAASNAGLDFVIEQTRDAVAEVAEGYLIYRNAHISGATLLHRVTPEGTEDLLSFEQRPADPS